MAAQICLSARLAFIWQHFSIFEGEMHFYWDLNIVATLHQMHHGWFLLGSSQRYWSSKQSNCSTLCVIYVFSFPLLAVTNHAPPVWHGSFASQQAAISKTHLLTLRLQEAAVCSFQKHGWGSWIQVALAAVTASAAHPSSWRKSIPSISWHK